MRAAAVLLAVLAAPALAVDVPQSTPRDHRIQRVNYHPDDVVRIDARAGYVSRIVFEPGETIIAAIPGFDAGWSREIAGHILYLRPLSIPGEGEEGSAQPEPGEWDTNLVVTTNRRMYDIDLFLIGSEEAGNAVYRLEFRYPSEEREQARQARADAEERDALDRVVERLPVPRNTDYSVKPEKDSRAIVPSFAYDDRRFTYLAFPGNREMPAAFVIGADGTEGVANTRIDPARSDVLVIDRVARHIVLRLGNAVVSVFNDSFDPHGAPPINGTTVPGLERVAAPDWSQLERAEGAR